MTSAVREAWQTGNHGFLVGGERPMVAGGVLGVAPSWRSLPLPLETTSPFGGPCEATDSGADGVCACMVRLQ